MKNLIILFVLLLISYCSVAQNKNNQNWQEDLTEFGFTENQDSIKIGNEIMRLMQDSTYRNEVYPPIYTWLVTIDLIEKNQLKKAFWNFINLYSGAEKDKNTIIQAVLKYDEIIDMEKALAASFYTYSFTDTEVVLINKGKRELRRPDILEIKFQNLTELVNIVVNQRIQKNNVNQPQKGK